MLIYRWFLCEYMNCFIRSHAGLIDSFKQAIAEEKTRLMEIILLTEVLQWLKFNQTADVDFSFDTDSCKNNNSFIQTNA